MRILVILLLTCACAHEQPAPEAEGELTPATFAEGTVPPVRKKCRSSGPKIPARSHANGRLGLDFTVTEEGKVKDVTVSGDASAGAIKAIRAFLATCSYQPATQGGKPVAVKWKGELSFPTRAPGTR